MGFLDKQGDDEFAEFARSASGQLVHAAFLMTGNRHTAEDAAQTALVRTYAAWRRIQRRDPYAYARTVLVNHLVDGWRRPYRENPTEELPDAGHREDIADEVANRRWLQAMLAALTPRERAVVVLRHYFDLSEQQVADELNVSLGTVKSINSRALHKLRVDHTHTGELR